MPSLLVRVLVVVVMVVVLAGSSGLAVLTGEGFSSAAVYCRSPRESQRERERERVVVLRRLLKQQPIAAAAEGKNGKRKWEPVNCSLAS